jgi:toxin ParE1/3/4
MSSRDLPVFLSAKARQDFVDILRYSGETWGEAQLNVYRGKIDQALQAISRNCEIGHRDVELIANHRLFLVGSHEIVYRIEPTRIGVVRILHQRMQRSRHLPSKRD